VARREERVDLVLSVLCSSELEISNAATERAKRASKYGSEDFEVDRRDSEDSLCLIAILALGLNDEEGVLEGIFGRVVDAEVVREVVVVVVVVLITDVINSFRGRFLLLGIVGRRGILSSSVLSPLKDPAPGVSSVA
jgi:hypothetical protein